MTSNIFKEDDFCSIENEGCYQISSIFKDTCILWPISEINAHSIEVPMDRLTPLTVENLWIDINELYGIIYKLNAIREDLLTSKG